VSDEATVVARYRAQLDQRGYRSDAAQLRTVERLEQLREELVAFRKARDGTLKRLINRPAVPRGVWLWGGVGRGKSFLMDCFFATVQVRRKVRVHFHEFMRGIHRELDSLKGNVDPLEEVARRIAIRHRLICFDEFHISDIADAMILDRLLRPLFELGTVFVMTSNYRPDQLYPDGLHRDRLLPAIELLNQQLDLVNVDAGTDYRRLTLAALRVYITPTGLNAEQSLASAFDRLAEHADDSVELRIENRNLIAKRRAGGVVWFDFATLCAGPRSQLDYLELAHRFHTLLLSGVPKLNAAMSSEARRFTWLIDILYDQRVKLLVSADAVPEQLYVEGPLSGEFHRTASRLIEMQSEAYLEQRRGPT
jgi:cell division protein ZapE